MQYCKIIADNLGKGAVSQRLIPTGEGRAVNPIDRILGWY
jgi:hypothetical protein